ncbi:hypothetical protein AB0C10_15620 [Microbispora amethystogenes]|uniref:hypothetical protein n=1 Tax=Microbispora amethystogenes TaxID=1427754 RepID=UPI0034095522
MAATTTGEQTTADTAEERKGPSVTRRIVRRVRHREREKLVFIWPVVWLAIAQLAAIVAHESGLGWKLAIVLAVAAIAVICVRAKRRGQKARLMPVAAGSAWLMLTTATGPYGWPALLLWVPGLAYAVPYWAAAWEWLHRTDKTPAPDPEPEQTEPEEKPVQVETTLEQEVQAWWAETVEPNHNAYAGTTLQAVEPVPSGFAANVIGVPGKTLHSQLFQNRGVIASARKKAMDQIAVEEALDGDWSGARLTVIDRGDNLLDPRYFEDELPVIDPATGMFRVGTFFDVKEVHWNFWTPTGGAQMGINAGGTGAGKSAFGALKIAVAHQTEGMAVILLDNQDGSSQPEWNGRTHVTREGVEAVWEEILAYDYVMGRRAHFVSHAEWADELGRERHGKAFLMPNDPDLHYMTMLYFAIEELPMLLKHPEYGKRATDVLGNAVKTWRKPGGAVDVFLQNVGLEEFGGTKASAALRSNLVAGGSVAAFRTGTSADHHMVGLKADPSKLPEYFAGTNLKTHGLGYIKGVDNRPGAKWRTLTFRDLYSIATRPAAGRIDPVTLGFYEEYWDMRKRGREPQEMAAAVRPAREQAADWSSGDVEAAIKRALRNGPMEHGALCVAVSRQLTGVKLGEIPPAARALIRAGEVGRKGDAFQLINA